MAQPHEPPRILKHPMNPTNPTNPMSPMNPQEPPALIATALQASAVELESVGMLSTAADVSQIAAQIRQHPEDLGGTLDYFLGIVLSEPVDPESRRYMVARMVARTIREHTK